MNIIGISRGNQYSPNHIGNDTAIFNEVMKQLAIYGYSFNIYTEEEYTSLPVPPHPIPVVNMARDKRTILSLYEWQQKGCLIITPPNGIENCIRQAMTEILISNQVNHPRSWIISVNQNARPMLTYPCWIKRGDSHTITKDDVCYAQTPHEVETILNEFRKRNIPIAIVNEHLQGDLIKFYGVKDSPFFYWFYPSLQTHSKFGLEKINGASQGFHFDIQALRSQANLASTLLKVPIYGGDAIISEEGNIQLIDFNDWPSFAPCRKEASNAIARYIHQQISIWIPNHQQE